MPRVRVNLIAPDLLAAQSRRRRIRCWTWVVVPACAVYAALWVAQAFAGSDLEQLRLELQSRSRQLHALRAEVVDLDSRSSAVADQLRRAAALQEKRRWSAVLGLLSETMPHGCWLASVATDPAVPGAAPSGGVSAASPAASPSTTAGQPPGATSPKPMVIDAPRRLRVIGFAADPEAPLAFVGNLKATQVFRDVSLERSLREPSEDAQRFRFDILCEW
ncbi:MAG: hypothetical protein AABZ12_00065 [Planctomycetota bacterium]